MIIQVLALLALVLALWTVFRFAMGLRWAKVSREDARAAEQARGRRLVAEIPLSDDEIVFFVEDEAGFYWGPRQARKRDIRGGRLLLNGAVMASISRDGESLPDPAPPEEYEGGERSGRLSPSREKDAITAPFSSSRPPRMSRLRACRAPQ